ncbi:MAG: endonuclease/exonuclease/phosphatase family protein [Candidatus Eisenbacteria bacterium]|uniref:Endonuclease/exonuclease/phosphatase family protein n=1 Tax=Eiseniibacteriota bacterium TaxID=2212470 RepID=A0A933WAB6_UNCEI|nr:endonuclease/exonuclease/phosphatase family protein [Candidatus Eisenbacteria bacterium]
MAHDPVLLDECRALVRAVTPFATIEDLHGSHAWRELGPRFDALLHAVRRYDVIDRPGAPRHSDRVRVVQWNIEHGNWYEQVEEAFRTRAELAAPDVVTLDEVDLGCARAGNRDVTGDLARALNLHAVWAPLFLETTVGRDDDAVTAAGRENEAGLFGIAVLSRWPIGEVRVLDLPSPQKLQFDLERMVGRHCALVAEILRPEGAFVAVAAHLEVHRTREHRAAQARVIADALAHERRPVVLAGDFNTHTFDRGLWHSALHGASALMLMPGPALKARLLHPDRGFAHEPLFDVLREAGFAWNDYRDELPSLLLREDRLEEAQALPGPLRHVARRVLEWAIHRGTLRLDWICGRGWRSGRGHTVRGLDGPGKASDHAPIVAELAF